MNRQQAQKIAARMVKKNAPAYAGRFSIHNHTGVPIKTLTDSAVKKILKEFHTLIVKQDKYPAIQVLFAKEQING